MAAVALGTICAAAPMGCAAIIVKSDGNSDPPVSAATEGSVWATRAASASTVIKDATVDVVSARREIPANIPKSWSLSPSLSYSLQAFQIIAGIERLCSALGPNTHVHVTCNIHNINTRTRTNTEKNKHKQEQQ